MLRCPPRRTKCGAGLVALQVYGAADRACLRSKSADLAMYLVGKSSKNAADRYPGISVWLSRSPGISV